MSDNLTIRCDCSDQHFLSVGLDTWDDYPSIWLEVTDCIQGTYWRGRGGKFSLLWRIIRGRSICNGEFLMRVDRATEFAEFVSEQVNVLKSNDE